MPTKFNMLRDINGFNGFGVTPSDEIDGVLLAAGAAQSVTVPSGEYTNYLVLFSYTPGSNVFVDMKGNTAAGYSGTAGAVTSELNPVARYAVAGQAISLITPDAGGAYAQISYYVIDTLTN